MTTIEPPSPEPAPPVPPPAQLHSERPPFWRRIFAFVIDALVLGVVCTIAGFFLDGWFSELGPWGRVFGGALGVLYFGIAASPICRGQTIGKRFMRIAVSRTDGSSLPLPAAFGRATLLMLPLACNGLAIAMTTWLVPTLASVIIFGLGGAILYLFLFNRATRQTVHDLATRSIVARVPAGERPIVPGTVWRTHFAILAAILILGAGIASFVALKVQRALDLSSLRRTQQDIASLAHTSHVQILYGSSWMTGGATQTWVRTSVMTYASPADREKLATSIADLILTEIPAAKARSRLIVTVSDGYDIVFASAWRSQTWNFSPSDWQERIARQRK